MSADCKPDIIFRQALGRPAWLGDLYDATTERFCMLPIFRDKLPEDSPAVSKTDTKFSNISFTRVSSLQDKLHQLNIRGELQLSILAGMVDLGGSAKYLIQKKQSFKSVECTMVYNIKTVTERLALNHEQIKDYICKEPMLSSCSATHVVTQIEYGANCALTVTDQNSENQNKREVEGKLALQLEKLSTLVGLTGEAAAQCRDEMSDEWTKFSIEFFGDVIPEGSSAFPQTLDGAVELMRTIPELVKNSNHGKGKPLSYVMLPLSCLDLHKPSRQTEIPVNVISEVWSTKIVNLFDHIAECKQKVYDQTDEIEQNRYCVTDNERDKTCLIKDELKLQEATAKQELAEIIKEISSVEQKVKKLDSFCNKHSEKAKNMLIECEKIYSAVRARIEYFERCRRHGVQYIAPTDQMINSASDDYDNVYVFFHGNVDSELTRWNESRFISLSVEAQTDNNTVCYITWSKEGGEARIKENKKGMCVNMAQCVPEEKQSSSSKPFQVRCPGSKRATTKKTWTCFKCNETLRLCPYYRAFYCHCGHASTDRFQFRCHDNDCCREFKHLDDRTMHKALRTHELMSCNKGNKLSF